MSFCVLKPQFIQQKYRLCQHSVNFSLLTFPDCCLPQCRLVLQRIVIACFHSQTDIYCAASLMMKTVNPNNWRLSQSFCLSSAAEQKSSFT